MDTSRFLHLLAVGLAFSPVAIGAQVAARKVDIPASHKPPAGLCRIWVGGVPAAKQPAPTDCAKALRNKPANGTVVFGEAKPAAARPAAALPPAALRRSVIPPVGSGRAVPTRDSAKQGRDTTRGGRDTTRGGRDTTRGGRDTTRGGRDTMTGRRSPTAA